MPSSQILKPFNTFTDVNGTPLDDGYVYIGQAGSNPESSPIQAYWDADLTQVAVQPIRTRGGYPLNAGQQSRFYVAQSSYSIRVKNKNGTQISEDLNRSSESAPINSIVRNDLVFRKRITAELPLEFPGYAAAFVAAGSPVAGFIYPQGHCYDADGRIFIKYANGTLAVIAWYNPDETFGGWFLIAPGGESLVIIHEGGVRKLYNKSGTDLMSAYDITVMPATGATVSGTSVGITGVGLEYAYGNGRWVIEQLQVDYGVLASRTKWAVYDSAFAKIGEFFVSKNLVGWQLSSSAFYNYVPKSQGIALQGDKVLFGIGGSYIPETDGPVAPVVAATGVASCSLDGSLLQYGVVDANKLINKLVEDGYNCIRSESEGLTLRPDGGVSHLIITLRPSSPGVTTTGILLYSEFDTDGEDYSALAHPYTPFDVVRTWAGTFPRNPDGQIYNPLTGAQFTTMTQILEYMAEMQMPRFGWYTSAITIVPIDGILLPTASAVSVDNQNNETFIITVAQVSGDVIVYGANLSTATSFKMSTNVKSLKTDEVDGSGNISGKIRSTNRNASDVDLLPLHQQSTTGGNLLNLGGGSSLFYAATRVWLWIGATLTTKTGVNVAEFFTNGLNPGADNGFDLGTAVKRWREIFTSKLTSSGPIRPGEYTLATLPAAASFNGYFITVTDATGGPKLCRSNGTVWQIANTTTTVS